MIPARDTLHHICCRITESNSKCEVLREWIYSTKLVENITELLKEPSFFRKIVNNFPETHGLLILQVFKNRQI